MNDLLEELFAELLLLRYGEKDRTAAETMARLGRLAMGQQQTEPRRRRGRKPSVPSAPDTAAGATDEHSAGPDSPSRPAPTSHGAPAADDMPEFLRRTT